jgi:bacteriocin-like protein
MKDLSLPEAFEELSTNELESVEGGFVFGTLLNVTSNIFRGTSETASDGLALLVPVADLLDRKADAVFGTVVDMAGIFREMRANRNM